jgi:hypothetical protein
MITLKEVQETLRSHAKINEFLYVLHDVKPVLRMLISKEEKAAVTALFKRANLHFLVADFRIIIHQDPAIGYSNKGEISQKGDIEIIYAGKDPSLLKHAKVFEEMRDDERLGQVLGYPQCCCTFFKQHSLQQAAKNNDFAMPLIEASKHDNLVSGPYDWRINVFLRYGDFVLLAHFPCSLQCAASLQIAEAYRSVVSYFRPTYMDYLREILHYDVVYTQEKGVFALRNCTIKNKKATFDHVIGTSNDALFKALDKDKHLIIDGPGSLIVGGNNIQASLLRFKEDDDDKS